MSSEEQPTVPVRTEKQQQEDQEIVLLMLAQVLAAQDD